MVTSWTLKDGGIVTIQGQKAVNLKMLKIINVIIIWILKSHLKSCSARINKIILGWKSDASFS